MELFRRKDSKLYWITYSINGRRYRESTKTHRKAEAEAFMAKRTRSPSTAYALAAHCASKNGFVDMTPGAVTQQCEKLRRG
jgi:hypothetical protein